MSFIRRRALRNRLVATTVVALGAVATLSSCAKDPVLSSDDRVAFVAPASRADVTLPVKVRWVLRKNINAAAFLVLVDRSPQPPGEGLEYFVRGRDECKGPDRPTCLEPDVLADRRIFVTTRPELTLAALAPRSGVSDSLKDRHEVTVVVLDRAGKRIGEANWNIQFTVKQPEGVEA